MARISVIVPVYKVEPYIRRCVDSILGQTFPDFELVLVDDGSPDGCGAICDEYARQDSRVHVIHQENGGLSAARNAGIDFSFANSDSQWLAFVDSDDWVHKEYLSSLYAAAGETGALLSACYVLYTSGEDFPPVKESGAQCLSADDYYCEDGKEGSISAIACAKLYHKSLFETLRYPVGKLHEDEFTTYLAVYQAGKVGVTGARLYAYFQNPTGIMKSRWDPRRMDGLEAAEEQIAFARKNDNLRLLRKAAEQYIYGSYNQLEQVEKLPEYRVYRKILRKKLRSGLALGRSCGVFPRCGRNLWAYEKAYPAKPVWWLISKVYGGK